MKIPREMTGYDDPNSPSYFLALVGVRSPAGEGDVVYINLENEKIDGVNNFHDLMMYLREQYPDRWGEVVQTASQAVGRINSPNRKVPLEEIAKNAIAEAVSKMKSLNVEDWEAKFKDEKTALETLKKVLSLEANALKGERIFPDLRIVGTRKLLTIYEVVENLHLLSFYRDAYPDWYELARRVAGKLRLNFPDIGSSEDKEVVVSEHLGILKYKFVPKVFKVTDEIKALLKDLMTMDKIPMDEDIKVRLVEAIERGDEEEIENLKAEINGSRLLDSLSKNLALLEYVLERADRLVIKTKMEATDAGGELSFGYSPVLVAVDEFGRDIATISVPLAEFYSEAEKRGIVNPREKYEVAEPDAELMTELVGKYVEHVRWIAREHLGIGEDKESKLKELARSIKSMRDFRREALRVLSEDGDFRLKALGVFKEKILEVTDIESELLSSVSTLMEALGKKELVALLKDVLHEVAQHYRELPFVFLSTRFPQDIESYMERFTSDEEEESFKSLPWIKEGQGADAWVKSLLEKALVEHGEIVSEDIVEDIKNTIFQTLSEHSALEEGIRQGTERFLTQYLFSFYLEPVRELAVEGNKKAGEKLIEMMRSLFVNGLGVMPHQYDEAINLLAKKVGTDEKGHLLGWEMRSGKTLAMSLMGYFSSLYFGKDTFMFPKTANMLDIIYQIATFTPQVAFNIKAYKSGDVTLGLVDERIYDIISDDIYPNIFAVRHMNKLLTGAGKTAEELLQSYGQDMEELISLYENLAEESGNPEAFYKEKLREKLDEDKIYGKLLNLEGFKPQVRLALYDYFKHLDSRGLLVSFKDEGALKAFDGLYRSLENLSMKVAETSEPGPFFTYHIVPKHHLFAVQYRIPRRDKGVMLKGLATTQIVESNRDFSLSPPVKVEPLEEAKEKLQSRIYSLARPYECIGIAGGALLGDVVNAIKRRVEEEDASVYINPSNYIAGVYTYIGESDIDTFFDFRIVEPARDSLSELLSEIEEGVYDEKLGDKKEMLLKLLNEVLYGDSSTFYKLLARGLEVKTEEIGSAYVPKTGDSYTIITNYLSFSFNEEVENLLEEIGLEEEAELGEYARGLIERTINGAMKRAFDEELLMSISDRNPVTASLTSLLTPVHVTNYLLTMFSDEPEAHIAHIQSVFVGASASAYYDSGKWKDSAEITLRLPSAVFVEGVPSLSVQTATEEVDGERVEVEKAVVEYRQLGRLRWEEGGDRSFTPYQMRDFTLTVSQKGRKRPSYTIRFETEREDIPPVYEMSTSNATNYFVRSDFFGEKSPVAIIDEADESTNPNAKGYLAFYYISQNSILSIASTGTPTSGDVKTPIALIGLVSGLPLDTIESSVAQVVDNFAVYTIKEDKTAPYLISQTFLNADSMGRGDEYVTSLLSSLFLPVIGGRLNDEQILDEFVGFIDSFNRDRDGSVIDPSVDYVLERIGSGDIPPVFLVADIRRLVLSFKAYLERKNIAPEDIVSAPDFKEHFISFLKEKKIASVAPGTYDPIGFVSMLSNASLLTRETLKKAINPEIEETKEYADLTTFMDMLSAQKNGSFEATFGKEIEPYATDGGQMRKLWDVDIASFKSSFFLQEVMTFYLQNLKAFVSEVAKKPENFLKKYVREELGKEALGTEELRLDNEEHVNAIVEFCKNYLGGSFREGDEKIIREKLIQAGKDVGVPVKGISVIPVQDEDGENFFIQLHLKKGSPSSSIDDGYVINLRHPEFSEAGSIPSPTGSLVVARHYFSAEKIVSERFAQRPSLPPMSKKEFQSLIEKSAKTTSDSVMDILHEYILSNFSWAEIEEVYDEKKVAVAKAIMREFVDNFLSRHKDIWENYKLWENRAEAYKKEGKEPPPFTTKIGDYEIVPYVSPILFGKRSSGSGIEIVGVGPDGAVILSVEVPNPDGATVQITEKVKFSEKISFYREDWELIKKEDADSIVIPYRLKYTVTEENELIDMFSNLGLYERVAELVAEGKNFLLTPSRKKMLGVAILDTLTRLYLTQKTRIERDGSAPTYHVLLRITDREHAELLKKIDLKELEKAGIVVKVFTHHTELDAEAKKLKGILSREKQSGEGKTRMIVIAPAKTVSRGVDFSMLDELVVAGTLDGNGRDFAQLLARLYNNKDRHHAVISMFGTPVRMRRQARGETSLGVNYSSLVQLKLLQKEEFIRAVMSGKIANILSRGGYAINPMGALRSALEGEESFIEEMVAKKQEELADRYVKTIRLSLEEKKDKAENSPKGVFRNVSPSL